MSGELEDARPSPRALAHYAQIRLSQIRKAQRALSDSRVGGFWLACDGTPEQRARDALRECEAQAVTWIERYQSRGRGDA